MHKLRKGEVLVEQQLEILNDVAHRDLRMRLDPGPQHPNFVMIVIGEFASAASTCPIFLAKDAGTGEFYVAALFGFQPGEVLVEQIAGRPAFLPLELQRQGFYASGTNIALDPAHSRFGPDATIALFEEDGTPSNALRKMQRTIGLLAGGVEETRDFIKEILRLDLVEPVDVSLEFDDGQRRGYLQAAITMSVSLNQVDVLARRRNYLLTAKS
jgi:hypothetical protein